MNSVWGGVGGEKLWHWLRGEDFNDAELEHQKSISQSHMLSPDLRPTEGAYAVLHKLLHKAAMRLRSARLWTTHLTLEIKFAVPKASATKQHLSGIPAECLVEGDFADRVPGQSDPDRGIAEALGAASAGRGLREAVFRRDRFGKSGSGSPAYLELVFEFGERVAATRISNTMDSLNLKYGTHTVMAASMLLAGAAAPTRIAFTSIPDLF